MRTLPVDNFRDVSGYRNADGLVMKKNRIFRGAALNHLSAEDALYMERELGIRYILDYRDEREADMKKDVLSDGMVYERIGALQTKTNQSRGFDFGDILSKEMSRQQLLFAIEYLRSGYAAMPFDNPAYNRLFELLLRNDGNIYFHCSAGKDRTGISAFLIMLALDMSEEDAIAEYLLSNQYLESFVKEFYRQHPVSEENRKYSDLMLYVARENIMVSIEAIKGKYDTYHQFLEKEYGIDAEQRRILKSIYCEG